MEWIRVGKRVELGLGIRDKMVDAMSWDGGYRYETRRALTGRSRQMKVERSEAKKRR